MFKFACYVVCVPIGIVRIEIGGCVWKAKSSDLSVHIVPTWCLIINIEPISIDFLLAYYTKTKDNFQLGNYPPTSSIEVPLSL